MEKRIDEAVRDERTARGHEIELQEDWTAAVGVRSFVGGGCPIEHDSADILAHGGRRRRQGRRRWG